MSLLFTSFKWLEQQNGGITLSQGFLNGGATLKDVLLTDLFIVALSLRHVALTSSAEANLLEQVYVGWECGVVGRELSEEAWLDKVPIDGVECNITKQETTLAMRISVERLME